MYASGNLCKVKGSQIPQPGLRVDRGSSVSKVGIILPSATQSRRGVSHSLPLLACIKHLGSCIDKHLRVIMAIVYIKWGDSPTSTTVSQKNSVSNGRLHMNETAIAYDKKCTSAKGRHCNKKYRVST